MDSTFAWHLLWMWVGVRSSEKSSRLVLGFRFCGTTGGRGGGCCRCGCCRVEEDDGGGFVFRCWIFSIAV